MQIAVKLFTVFVKQFTLCLHVEILIVAQFTCGLVAWCLGCCTYSHATLVYVSKQRKLLMAKCQ